ncbi:methyltransferase domain-containing protein [Colletotrichum tofieldiae]|nr:methyltransferase domain-containing protein [Colletotrichum tofieldiae]GKT72825.1 methyltransferase domain-containing protein [Colletotrichum tofieldiae]GKT89329.1 methyltransferase domain-containing protein [Colletotrichum tofieldiae]
MTAAAQPLSVPSLERWNREEGSVYMLNSGDLAKERERLEYNHYNIWLPLCGGLCPPHILEYLRQLPSPHVAEIATGTGVWLKDMAKQLPVSAMLRGIDMDSTKFPRASELPPNCSMMQHNALRPFPEQMLGTFDMVHVRLLRLGLKKEDWETLAHNIFALLRPGGYLHWEEVADSSWKCIPPSRAFDEWKRIETLWAMSVGRDPFMPAQLPIVLRNVGFTDVDEKIWNTYGVEDKMRGPMTKISTEIVRRVMLAVLEDGGTETLQSMKDIDRLESGMRQDVLNGALVGFSYTWIWGRHP